MIKLSKEKVLLLHQLITEETGGSKGVRDVGLLESALNNAYATFGGEELYYYDCEDVVGLKAEAVKGIINLIGVLTDD